jgi:hypothetical protein
MIQHPEPGSTLNGDPRWRTFEITAPKVWVHVGADGLVCIYGNDGGGVTIKPRTDYQPATTVEWWHAGYGGEPVTLTFDEGA